MGCSLNTYWRAGKTNGNSEAAQRKCRKEPHPRAAGIEGRWLGIRTPKLRRALGIELQISEFSKPTSSTPVITAKMASGKFFAMYSLPQCDPKKFILKDCCFLFLH